MVTVTNGQMSATQAGAELPVPAEGLYPDSILYAYFLYLDGTDDTSYYGPLSDTAQPSPRKVTSTARASGFIGPYRGEVLRAYPPKLKVGGADQLVTYELVALTDES